MQTTTQTSEIREILEAAADVIFSDGVSPAFLEHWERETAALLLIRRANTREPVGAPR